MTIKDFMGLLVLAFGIVGVFGGIAGVARSFSFAWILLVLGVALAFLSYRMLRTKEEAHEERAP